MFVGQTKPDSAEDVSSQALLSVLLLESLLPEGGREVQDATERPGRQETEEVTKVGPGLEPVHLAARDKADEGGVHLAGVVVPDEEPVLAADSESLFILPMSVNAPLSATDGIRSSAPR